MSWGWLVYIVIALAAAAWGKFEINNERVTNPAARLLFGLIWPAWVALGAVIFSIILIAFLAVLVRLPFSSNPNLTLYWRDRAIYRNGQWVAKR